MTLHTQKAEQIVKTWASKGQGNYGYYQAVEATTDKFWGEDTAFRKGFDRLDHRVILEIACGVGRHAERILNGPFNVDRYIAADTSPDALEEVRSRLGHDSRLEVYQIQGDCGLPADLSAVTAVFSYDSMVHFELMTMWGYLQEIERVLLPGGRAWLHYSNDSSNPTGDFKDNPGWRNYMIDSTFRHLASRAGLSVESMLALDWSGPESDALSMLVCQRES